MSVVLTIVFVSLVVGLAAAVVTAYPGIARTDAGIQESGREQVEGAIEARPGLVWWVRGHLRRRSAGFLLLLSLLLVAFAVAVALGALVSMVNHHSGLARADSSVARWGSHHATDASVTLVKWITQLGSTPVIVASLLVVATLEAVRRREWTEVFAFVAAVAIGELLLANGVKALVRRDRPDVAHLVAASGWSFPSGHAANAAAAWAAIAFLLGVVRSRRARTVFNAAAVTIAVAVATSRALLGVHWLTDVLGGLVLGWGWYLMVSIAFGGRRQRLGEPVEEAVDAVTEEARG